MKYKGPNSSFSETTEEMENRRGLKPITSSCRTILGLVLFIFLPLFIYQNSTYTSFWSLRKQFETFQVEKAQDHNTLEGREEKLLDGLIPVGFDEESCLSRYESYMYRKPSPYKPSSHLISKLRSYERLHSRCGPNSKHYYNTNTTDCNYIVWLPVNGLGNRMLSLAATFLYAILTDRVLLVSFESEMSGVFCEPFLNSTWNLPNDFPHNHNFTHLPTYDSLVKDMESSIDVPPFVYVNLVHESHEHERYFHCDDGQTILKKAPFLILFSDQYFVPSLFMIPSFQQEMNAMFPEKDTVFHHLGRYLLSPSNEAWTQITRLYKDNFSKADKKLGIQVRVFYPKVTPTTTVMEQILACAINNQVLPQVDQNKDTESTNKTTAVLVTSLYKEYSENLTVIYKTGKTTTGEVVRVFQPSHEEVQRFHNNNHHVKALTEMYLLSLCDKLVTSGFSTFGYVARGLGAVNPWIMYMTKGDKFRDPPCTRTLSIEPCFHFPPKYDCKRKSGVDHISSIFPQMRHCEDFRVGVKMVGQD